MLHLPPNHMQEYWDKALQEYSNGEWSMK